MERDELILKEINRWQCILGRHIKELAGFSGSRACDRRLKILLTAGYINRKKILFGIPYIYTLTNKSKKYLNLPIREDKIRIEQIKHDITVLDVLISLMNQSGLTLDNVISEKELHRLDGFGVRKHKPDFVINEKDKKVAIEIELSLKAVKTLEKNIKDNFMNYDIQIWYIERNNIKLNNILNEFQEKYSNLEIKYLER